MFLTLCQPRCSGAENAKCHLQGDPTYLIVKDDGSGLVDFGLNAICTHLGCVVPWVQVSFLSSLVSLQFMSCLHGLRCRQSRRLKTNSSALATVPSTTVRGRSFVGPPLFPWHWPTCPWRTTLFSFLPGMSQACKGPLHWRYASLGELCASLHVRISLWFFLKSLCNGAGPRPTSALALRPGGSKSTAIHYYLHDRLFISICGRSPVT